MKILAAHQPQFAPWLGFFNKMDRADVFVLLDNVQFKKNEWQNRNRIKGPGGPQWLTVPVSFRHGERIDEVAICDRQNWRRRHLVTLRSCYGRAPFFKPVFTLYDELSQTPTRGRLVDLNLALLESLRSSLGIATSVVLASEIAAPLPERDGRLIALCKELGADTYLAGPGGRDYMELERYRAAGIRVVFQEFQHPVYPQRFGEFESSLSVLDLLFNCGPRSLDAVRGRSIPEDEVNHEHTGDRLPSR